jgi:micrococcal nuclease
MLISFCSLGAFSQTQIAAADASKHIGDSVIIIEKVYSAKAFDNGMILLNLGGSYPNHLLVVMIEPKAKALFKYAPEQELKDKKISVTGKLIDYKGKPEIVVHDPKQIVQLYILINTK